MSITRRQVLQMVGTGLVATRTPLASAAGIFSKSALKPPRLKPGQTVGLINPAGATFHPEDVVIAEETFAALGLKMKAGAHLLDRYGYLAGTDEARAADVNSMYADPDVDAIITIRGGWGCNRILNFIDYKTIEKHPKIIMGYSDITSLLLALNAKTSLVTFHGPVGISTWNEYSTDFVKRLMFEGQAFTMENPTDKGDNLTQVKDRVLTIHGGQATGKLLEAIYQSSHPWWAQTIFLTSKTISSFWKKLMKPPIELTVCSLSSNWRVSWMRLQDSSLGSAVAVILVKVMGPSPWKKSLMIISNPWVFQPGSVP